MLLGGSVEVAPGRAEDYGDTRIIHVLVTLSLSVSGLKAALGKQPRRRTRHVGARIRVQIWRRPSDYAGAVSLQLQLFMICSQNGRRADEDARSVRLAAVVQPRAQGEVVRVTFNPLKTLDSEKAMKGIAKIPGAFSTHKPRRKPCAEWFCK